MGEEKENDSGIASVVEQELILLGRHLDILKTVQKHGPIGIIRISQLTGKPQHMVRYSLRTLEKNGFIRASPEGAVITDNIDKTVTQLLSTLDILQKKISEIKQTLKKQ